MKYKIVTCGKCLNQIVAYSDIHRTTWRCPVCSTVHGVKYEDTLENYEFCDARVAPHIAGEGEYDWDWLEYDKPKRAGADA